MKLVTVTSKTILNELKNNEDITLVYPLNSYTVGFTLTFDIKEIDGFVLINRILDDFDLDKLDQILHQENKIKGIIFDDLGILELVKDLDIIKILSINHYGVNSKSINYYLEYVDSVVVSNDITKEEILKILDNANKKLVVNVFGLKDLMYSRRKLLTNYVTFYKLENSNLLDASIDDKGFKIVENEYGTVFYAKKYYNALELLGTKNVLYYWYNPLFLDDTRVKEVVINNNVTGIDCDKLFLDKKTTYRVGE